MMRYYQGHTDEKGHCDYKPVFMTGHKPEEINYMYLYDKYVQANAKYDLPLRMESDLANLGTFF